MSVPRYVLMVLTALTPAVSFAAEEPQEATGTEVKAEPSPAARPTPEARAVMKCDAHGVKKTICARCKPKLATAYKSKGDWCSEHERPESQCAICHPELKKQGVKP